MVKKYVLLCYHGKEANVANHFFPGETYALDYINVLYFRQDFVATEAIKKFNAGDKSESCQPPFAVEITRDEAASIGDIDHCIGAFIDYNFRSFSSADPPPRKSKKLGYDWEFFLMMPHETYNLNRLHAIVKKYYGQA